MAASSIGFVVFIYGKKQAAWKPMAGGGLLFVLPYLLQRTAPLLVASGLVLAALYIFRD